MKLSARDIDAFLKAPDARARAVLIYGPDGGLVRERSRAVAGFILGKDSDPLNRVEFTGDQVKSDPACLRDELGALSLMAGRRVIVIREAGDKIAPAIENAFENLVTDTYLVIESDELSPSAPLRALFERDNRFASLPCYREEGRSLEDSIRAFLSGRGFRVSPDAIHYLGAHLGNDRGVTMSELEKLALYMGAEKEITLRVAVELSGHNASETIEDICHSVAEGKMGEAQALLARLLGEGTQGVAIIRSLLKHFQKLDQAAAHMEAGMSSEQAIAQLRPPVFFKSVPLFKRELSRWRSRPLANALTLLLRTEKELKSGLLPQGLLMSQAIQQTARLGG